ncbi:MAG: hypothetical protein ACYCZF_15730 [Anaerolineae bacterium]
MTSFDESTVECVICGHINDMLILTSTNSFGAPDLDSRVAGMARDTLPFQVMVCVECGHCAHNLEQLAEGAAEIVRSAAYQAQLADPGLPTLANQFLCRALIASGGGQFAFACWDALRAAWACDDEQPAVAIRCRELALQYWDQAQQAGQNILDLADDGSPNDYQYLLRVDVHRRSGQIDQARDLCDRTLKGKLAAKLRLIMQYELVLIADGDTASHTLSEADLG